MVVKCISATQYLIKGKINQLLRNSIQIWSFSNMLQYIPGQIKYETQPVYDLKLIDFSLKLVDLIWFSFWQQRSFNYDKATAFRLSFIVRMMWHYPFHDLFFLQAGYKSPYLTKLQAVYTGGRIFLQLVDLCKWLKKIVMKSFIYKFVVKLRRLILYR